MYKIFISDHMKYQHNGNKEVILNKKFEKQIDKRSRESKCLSAIEIPFYLMRCSLLKRLRLNDNGLDL